MDKQHVVIPIVVAIIALLLIVGGVAKWAGSPPLSPSVSTTTPTTTDQSSSPVTTPTKPVVTKPAPTPSVARGDSLTADVTKGTLPLTVGFTATLNSSLSCAAQSYTLDFGDNTSRDLSVGVNDCSKPTVTKIYHLYQRAGTYIAALTTRSTTDRPDETIKKISITIDAQSVTAGSTKYGTLTVSPPAGTAPFTITVSLSATDASESTGVYYQANFGEGESIFFPRTPKPSLTHTYTAAGGYLVSVSRRTACSAGICDGPSFPLGSISVSVQ